MSENLVAVLGGGQLGRMLGVAGIPLGLQFRFLDPIVDAPAAAVGELGGLPAVLKTRRGGYDGKGQRVLRAAADLDDAWAELGSVPLVLESLIPFERELSVLAVRGADGVIACWPLVENHHEAGI